RLRSSTAPWSMLLLEQESIAAVKTEQDRSEAPPRRVPRLRAACDEHRHRRLVSDEPRGVRGRLLRERANVDRHSRRLTRRASRNECAVGEVLLRRDVVLSGTEAGSEAA